MVRRRATLLFLTFLASVLLHVSSAQTPHSFDEIGVSLELPESWVAQGSQELELLNTEARNRAPGTRFVYVAKFAKEPQPQGYPTFILVQKTPGRATAEQLMQVFPKIKAKTEDSMEQAFADVGATAQMQDPYLDEKLGMIVLPLSVNVTGMQGVGRSYIIPMEKNIVSINVYSAPENAAQVFAEVEPCLAGVKLDPNHTLKENWVDSLRNLLSR
jgi:hypothetical protein